MKRKLIALLDQVFPEYEKLFSDTFGVTSMKLLENYSTPEQMLSATLADLLSKASRGRFGIVISQYIEQLKSFEKCIEIFDAEIAKIYDTFDCQLHTITGTGGDISKFESVPKLVAFAGLYPKNRQSGESINSKGWLSKRGSPYLRRAIWLAAFVAAFKDTAIKTF